MYAQLPYVPERVPLNRLTNIYACRVLASICNFLAFYLAEETDQMVQVGRVSLSVSFLLYVSLLMSA